MPRIRTAPLERTRVLDASGANLTTDHDSLSKTKHRGFGAVVLDYIALTKPRIIELLLITTIPTMFVAAKAVPGVWLMVWTFLGGTFAAGGANAINMVVDRDIDQLMERTKSRPLPQGRIKPRNALIFAIILEIIAFALLWSTVNLLSAVLAVSGCLFYVFIYTLWLKRTSTQNIVIGGAAGAVPVLVGYSAVTNSLGWAPVVLFLVIFAWTPPHYWPLAMKYSDDYARAEVPMLPVVASFSKTANQIVAYTLLMIALTIGFGPVAGLGNIYQITAVVTGAIFLYMAIRLRKIGLGGAPVQGPAMALFGYSITYVSILFASMIIDVLVYN